jgi:hypothetical protein
MVGRTRKRRKMSNTTNFVSPLPAQQDNDIAIRVSNLSKCYQTKTNHKTG